MDDFSKKVKRLFSKYHPNVKLSVAFKAPRQIRDLFPFKDKIKDTPKQSLIIYQLKCKNCDHSYIGRTERTLAYRVNEHRKSKSSSVYDHQEKTGHTIDFDNVKILDKANFNWKLQFKEVLHINSKKPAINKQLNSQSSYKVPCLIIAQNKY